jgi:hypothetical protein
MIAIHQQDEIEVYVHTSGDVAIRQQSGMEDADVVLVAPENVEKVIRALRNAKRDAQLQADQGAA